MTTIPPASTPIENINVVGVSPLPAPSVLHAGHPLTAAGVATVVTARREIAALIGGMDSRLLVVVGPCSVHDLTAAREYAGRLASLASELATQLLVVMRVYFEKPRTTIGWKGLINDPELDDSFDIERGLSLARGFLVELAELGLPAATEALDPVVPQYLGDLISWYAIGARTTESQTHREMASGLSAPCGFKNGTDGNIAVALNAIQSARAAHHFLGIDSDGRTAVIRTRGNDLAHLILRGGGGPNHDAATIARCRDQLANAGLPEAIMIDCSHGNSGKDPARQVDVALDVVTQRMAGARAIVGLMLESHLAWGNQPFTPGQRDLVYGVSITDACMDWATTEKLLRRIATLCSTSSS